MTYNVNLSAAQKHVRANALAAAIGPSATVRIYSGTQPVSPEAGITSQVLLASIPCASFSFGIVSEGMIIAGPITPKAASASGTASWARISTSTGVAVLDVDVGTANASLTVNTVNIIAPNIVTITSITISE